MVLARNVADALPAAQLNAHVPAYLLGSTSPDIRVLTRQDRLSTHFFDLNVHDHQDSVAGFFAAQGRFAAPEQLNPETRAWVCGYLTHLTFDEQYIVTIYRRFFAPHEALGGRMRANIMDRLLQFAMDRQYGEDPAFHQLLARALAGAVENIEVAGFIEPATLDRWRQVTLEIAARAMDWERMRGMVANHLRFAGLEEGETLASFLDSLPELLDATMAHVTEPEVQGYIERASALAAGAIERYLGCR
jgi:hypothetical protein